MIVYFTGTGNSRHCARLLARELGEECRDAAEFLREGKPAWLRSQKPWIFVCPTYAWQMPRVFEQFIREGEFAGSDQAYFVMTCGSEIGRAWENNRELCIRKDFSCRGTLPVAMPDNYILLFRAPGREEAERMVRQADTRLQAGARFIREGKDFPPVPAAALRCVGCGKCARLCPLGNIRMEEGRPHWGDRCTHCMACLCGCPTGAIEYDRATKGKERYHFPGPEEE